MIDETTNKWSRKELG